MGDAGGGVAFYDADTLEPAGRVGFAPARSLRLAYAPDGRWLAAVTSDRARVIDLAGCRVAAEWKAHPTGAVCVAVRPDGAALATAGRDGVRVWSAAGERLAAFDFLAFALADSPDGRTLATVEQGRAVRLRDAGTGRVIRELYGHGERPLCVAFSPDGTRLASGGLARAVRVWDVESGQELLALPGVEGPVQWVRWSAEGRRIVAYDFAVRVYEAPHTRSD